jgi:hypothetical protein
VAIAATLNPRKADPTGAASLAVHACPTGNSHFLHRTARRARVVLRGSSSHGRRATLQIAHELDSERLAHTRQQAQWQVGRSRPPVRQAGRRPQAPTSAHTGAHTRPHKRHKRPHKRPQAPTSAHKRPQAPTQAPQAPTSAHTSAVSPGATGRHVVRVSTRVPQHTKPPPSAACSAFCGARAAAARHAALPLCASSTAVGAVPTEHPEDRGGAQGRPPRGGACADYPRCETPHPPLRPRDLRALIRTRSRAHCPAHRAPPSSPSMLHGARDVALSCALRPALARSSCTLRRAVPRCTVRPRCRDAAAAESRSVPSSGSFRA